MKSMCVLLGEYTTVGFSAEESRINTNLGIITWYDRYE